MERLVQASVLRPLILGIVAGTLVTGLLVSVLFGIAKQRHADQAARDSWRTFERKADELLDHLALGRSSLCYMKVVEDRWIATSILKSAQLKALIGTSENELLIPVFPSVYVPGEQDDIYYDSILKSDIAPGDKVLVIGTGSGSDAWVAWLKSQSPIYVIDVNPMAIVNAKAAAGLGGFTVKAALGDIRTIQLPSDFADFDFVLWNMPYLSKEEGSSSIVEKYGFHDGDDGSILKRLLAILPSLLKKGGTAVLLNTTAAMDVIKSSYPGVKTEGNMDITVYTIANDAG